MASRTPAATWVAAALLSMCAALRSAAASSVVVDDRDHGAAACALEEQTGAPAGTLDARARVCTLARDVELSGVLRIAADRLTLDCDGHRVRGAGGIGRVEIVGRAHVTVRDCVLENVAIRVVASRDVSIVGNHIAGAFDAVAAFATTLLRIADNQLSGGGGITLSLVDKALVRDNHIAGAFTGLEASGVTRALIARNTVVDAAGVAIGLAYARDNTLNGNVVERCGGRGLELLHASENLLAGNRVAGCGAGVYARRSPAGIAVTGGRDNRIVDNRVTGNQVGVLFGGDENVWSANRVLGSAVDDLALDPEVGCDNQLDADNQLATGRPLIVTRDHAVVRGGRHRAVLVCGAHGVLLAGVEAGTLLVRRAPLVVVHGCTAGQVVLSGSDFGLFVDNRLGGHGRPAVIATGSRFVTFARSGPASTISGCAGCILAETAARAAAPDARFAAR